MPEPDSTQAVELSIVVAVISGGSATMRRCLEAIGRARGDHAVEAVVPYDGRLDGVADLAARFPWARFIEVPGLDRAVALGAATREHHDVLRAHGLAASRGALVGLVEDHGSVAPGWCEAAIEAHRSAWAGVGGAIENGVDRPLNHAVCACDFGRYQNPVPEGASAIASDANVVYKRSALEQVREVWRRSFHETAVNHALSERGLELTLSRRMIVYQTREGLRLAEALRERYVWGRSYAASRVRGLPAARRMIFAAMSFLLPALLTWRILRDGLRRGGDRGRLLAALPLIALLETAWSAGELLGYLTGSTGHAELEAERGA